MQAYYMLFANTFILSQILDNDKKLSRHAAIASIILPAHCSWCATNTPIAGRNTLTVDKDFVAKYTTIMGISERILKDVLKELQSIGILHKAGAKGQYYCNPWWAAAGDDDAIVEYRQYCLKEHIFAPWKDISLNIKPSRQKHIRCMANLYTASRYMAFCGPTNTLNTTDVITMIVLAYRSKMITYPKTHIHRNYVIITGKDQQDICRQLGPQGPATKTLRDSLKKLTDLHLLHKVEGINGAYLINPLIMARGISSNIETLQAIVANVDCDLYDRLAAGEISRKKDGNKVIYTYVLTGEIIREVQITWEAEQSITGKKS